MEFLRIRIEDVGFSGGLLRGSLCSGLCGLLCYCLGASRSGAISGRIIDTDFWLYVLNIDAVQNAFTFVLYRLCLHQYT